MNRERERGKKKRASLPQPVHPVSPLMCAFIKTKSSLASTAPSVISFSNKTKGNGLHFLLELIVPDLCALKLRGGRARQQTCCWRVPVLVQFGCPAAHLCLCLLPFHSRLLSLSPPPKSVQPAAVGALAQVASFTQTHSRGFGFHVAPEERRKHLLWRPKSFRCMCVYTRNQSWVCSHVKQGPLSVLSGPQLQQRTQKTEQQWKHKSRV